MVGYSVFGAVFWVAYALPGSKVRATFYALAGHVREPSPTQLFRRYVSGLLRGLDGAEQVRHGYTDAIDAMLEIPERARLEGYLQEGGVILALPHAHASLAGGRAMSMQYPLIALVRTAQNKKRALGEYQTYAQFNCDCLDVRYESPSVVARRVLSTLKNRQMVLGTVDRLRSPPPADSPVASARDLVRAEAFGQPIGIAGWPARFGAKSGARIVPTIVTQSRGKLTVVLGKAVQPEGELVADTQAWVSELEALLRAHPEEWTFALDRQWSRVLRGHE